MQAVRKFRNGRKRRKSRMYVKQERLRLDMCVENESSASNIMPRFLTGELVLNEWSVEGPSSSLIIVSDNLAICVGRPMSMNSVFEEFRHSKFDDIQVETEVNALSRRSMDSRYWFGENDMNSCVSSA